MPPGDGVRLRAAGRGPAAPAGRVLTEAAIGPLVAGIGCRRGCPAEDILAIIAEAERRADGRVDRLAAADFKRGEVGLRNAARMLGLSITFVGAEALAAVQNLCPTRSKTVARHTGFASVAEAAALAASGGTLLLARIANARATCALARA